MKTKLVIVAILLSVLTPVSAEGFFNRDCPNLKKRVVKLQKQSDRAWDKYITAIGRGNKSLYYSSDEVVIRLRNLAGIGIRITDDMKRYTKCISPNYIAAQWNTELKKIKAQEGFFYSALPFKEKFNYLIALKK